MVSIAREKSLELLGDIERAARSLLVHEFGVPVRAVRCEVHADPTGLSVRVERDDLPPSLRHTPGALDEIMIQLARSIRAVVTERLPSLAQGLRVRYVQPIAQIEFLTAPDLDPAYPNIITVAVARWQPTKYLIEHPGALTERKL